MGGEGGPTCYICRRKVALWVFILKREWSKRICTGFIIKYIFWPHIPNSPKQVIGVLGLGPPVCWPFRAFGATRGEERRKEGWGGRGGGHHGNGWPLIYPALHIINVKHCYRQNVTSYRNITSFL